MSPSSQNPNPTSTTRLYLEVSKDGWTGGLQLSINELDDDGRGSGYRLAGPKFNGSSKSLLKTEIDAREADEIRKFLDAKFPPQTDPQGRRLPTGFRRDVVVAVKCAVCEYEYDEDECYTVHFESVKQATDAVKDAGWTVLTDGRVVCDSDEEDHDELRQSGGDES